MAQQALRTEAGKRLLRWLDYHRATGEPLPPNDEAAVAAIEAEAVAAYRATVAAKVLDLDACFDHDAEDPEVSRAAVLALIEQEGAPNDHA